MTDQFLNITVGTGTVSIVKTPAATETTWAHFIYAPGAGSNINDGFGEYLAGRLATSGISTVRFQFPYMEAGRRRPDSHYLLESTWREVIEFVRPEATNIAVGGRSMGGRIASQVVSQGTFVDALALFAYPLRPPNNPERIRNEHFPEVTIPTLLCSGTRDSFGTPEELTVASADITNATVHLLDGADHGFKISKLSGKSSEDVWADAAEAFVGWMRSLFG